MIDVNRLRDIVAAIDAHQDMREPVIAIERVLVSRFGATFRHLGTCSDVSLAGIYAQSAAGGHHLIRMWVRGALRHIHAADEAASQEAA